MLMQGWTEMYLCTLVVVVFATGMDVQICKLLPVHVSVVVGSPTQQEKASIAGAIDSEKALKAETSRAIRGSSYSA